MKLAPLMGWSLTAVSLVASYGCSGLESGPSPTAGQPQNVSSLETRPVLNIGFVSVSRLQASYDSYKPLADHLTANTPYRFRVINAQNSDDLLGFLEERYTEIAFLEALAYLDAHKQFGAAPLAKPLNRDGEPVARSVFITRKDSSLGGLSELEGHSLALSYFHSTWGNLIPRYGLVKAGIRLEALKSLENLEEDEEVAQSVLNGRFDAGAVKEVVAHRRQADGLQWLHVCDPTPSGPLVARPDLPTSITQAILRALLLLEPGEAAGRSAWNEEIRYGFVGATDADYEPLRKMLATPTGCEERCHQPVVF